MKARQIEIVRLEKKKRKQEIELISLKKLHEKQNNVLKRKSKEVSNVRGQLRQSQKTNQTMKKSYQDELQDVRSKQTDATVNSTHSTSGSVKKTLDRLLSVSLRVDIKRKQLESSRSLRKETKITMDALNRCVLDDMNPTDEKERKKKVQECQAQLRICSARISVLNHELNQAKEEMNATEDVTTSFSSSTDIRTALKYLFNSLVHRAKKSKKSQRDVTAMQRKLHQMRCKLLQSETTKHALSEQYDAKLLAVQMDCETRVNGMLEHVVLLTPIKKKTIQMKEEVEEEVEEEDWDANLTESESEEEEEEWIPSPMKRKLEKAAKKEAEKKRKEKKAVLSKTAKLKAAKLKKETKNLKKSKKIVAENQKEQVEQTKEKNTTVLKKSSMSPEEKRDKQWKSVIASVEAKLEEDGKAATKATTTPAAASITMVPVSQPTKVRESNTLKPSRAPPPAPSAAPLSQSIIQSNLIMPHTSNKNNNKNYRSTMTTKKTTKKTTKNTTKTNKPSSLMELKKEMEAQMIGNKTSKDKDHHNQRSFKKDDVFSRQGRVMTTTKTTKTTKTAAVKTIPNTTSTSASKTNSKTNPQTDPQTDTKMRAGAKKFGTSSRRAFASLSNSNSALSSSTLTKKNKIMNTKSNTTTTILSSNLSEQDSKSRMEMLEEFRTKKSNNSSGRGDGMSKRKVLTKKFGGAQRSRVHAGGITKKDKYSDIHRARQQMVAAQNKENR